MRRILIGVMVVAAASASAARGQEQFHTLRFLLHPDLVAGLGEAELAARIGQYAADLNGVFGKQTTRRFLFDPASGITVTDTQPHTGSAGVLPETGYEVWVHAVLTDNRMTSPTRCSITFTTWPWSGRPPASWTCARRSPSPT